MTLRLFGSPYGSMWDDPWAGEYFNFPTPSQIFNQHFGLGLTDDDLLPPVLWRGMEVRPRATNRIPQQTGMSQVVSDDKEFKAMVDVSHFAPEEVNVKVVDDRVVISGKHEEKKDEHGFIKREFTRQYLLPKDVDPKTVKSTMAPNGVLTVSAPKLALKAPKERMIPIEQEKQSAMDTSSR